MSEPFDVLEATNRTMDRLMATAKYGRQPIREGAYTEIRTTRTLSGKEASVALKQSDIEAVIVELQEGLPCGICHQNPCAKSWERGASA